MLVAQTRIFWAEKSYITSGRWKKLVYKQQLQRLNLNIAFPHKERKVFKLSRIM